MSKFQPKKHSLVIEEGEKNQRTINLESKTCSIGRHPNNLIVLDSPQISRYHATLLRITIPGAEGDRFRIIDGDLKGRRSKNGFKVNGNMCFSYDLQHGDVITFCEDITATYYAVDAPKRTKVAQIFSFFEEEEDTDATCSITDSVDSLPRHQSHSRPTLNKSQKDHQALIQQSLERLASFPELFSDPIIEIDLKGNIIYLNPAALKRFPALKKDKLKHPILVGIISLIKAKKQSYLIREVRIGNRIFEESIHLISASQLVRCYVSDITKRKKAEILLRRGHQELEKRVNQRTMELAQSNEILKAEIAERKRVEQEIRLLQTITQAITEASNFDDAISITLRKVCETIDWAFGEAWIPDCQEKTLKLSPSWYSSTINLALFKKASEKFDFPSGIGIPGRVWKTKQPKWIEDVSLSETEQICLRDEIAQKTGLKSALGVPIIANNKVIAVFVFFDNLVRIENIQMVELVTSVAAQLGLIMERKQAEQDIRRSLEQEKKLNQLKTRFVTMASHEFRTPLASILSSAELLEHYSHKWGEDKKLNHLHRIQTSVKHMTELLNDVLLLGKADSNKLELNPSKINLLQFCQELVEEIQLTTETHQIMFQSENYGEINDIGTQRASTTDHECNTVYMDEKILRHILNNLLSNAIKYSPDSDKINFDLICQSKQAIFRIQDFGIGIPVEEHDQLFDSFHRANNVGSIPGTGLGLPIVKRSVDLYGGTIIMDSKIGAGTTFTVTVPYLVLK